MNKITMSLSLLFLSLGLYYFATHIAPNVEPYTLYTIFVACVLCSAVACGVGFILQLFHLKQKENK